MVFLFISVFPELEVSKFSRIVNINLKKICFTPKPL